MKDNFEMKGKVFPPCIDAYRWVDPEEFEKAMRYMADSWGAQAVGETLLRTGKPPVDDKGRIVLAIGWLPERGCFAAVSPLEPFEPSWARAEKVEIVEFEWPDEWDVT